MKILIFIYSMGSGGAERVTANIANYWAGKGWDNTIVTLESKDLDFYTLHPSINRIALMLACDSNNIFYGITNNFQRIFALRRIICKVQPKIALGMMTTANILLALSSLGVPSLHTIGSERIYAPKLKLGLFWETLRRFTYGLLNVVLVLTNESKEWMKKNTNSKKVVVIPNCVIWPMLDQIPKINPDIYCRSKRKILLAAGRLDTQKGFDWLIEVFSNLSPKHFDWDLIIIGEGPLRMVFENQIQELGLEERIFLPGQVGNISEWYERAELYVMSSRFEGFPNTLLEGMAHGLAVVSFDCDTGPRDIILQEENGLLIPLGDVSCLRVALDRLMGDPLMRQSFGKKAIEVRERFSMNKIMNMWEKLFEEILHGQSK